MNARTRGFVIMVGVCWIVVVSASLAQELKPFVPAPAPVPQRQPAPVEAAPVIAVPAQTVSIPTAQVPGSLPTPVAVDRPSQPAVPTKEVPSPAAPSNMPESVAWALGGALALQYLKKTGWFTFLSDQSTQRAKAIFGFFTAFLTAAGIQFVVSGSVLDAGGASVTATGITLVGIKDVIFQWIAQEGWYRGLVQRTRTADLVVHRQNASAPVDHAIGSV